jgi:hypothetical protein
MLKILIVACGILTGSTEEVCVTVVPVEPITMEQCEDNLFRIRKEIEVDEGLDGKLTALECKAIKAD